MLKKKRALTQVQVPLLINMCLLDTRVTLPQSLFLHVKIKAALHEDLFEEELIEDHGGPL